MVNPVHLASALAAPVAPVAPSDLKVDDVGSILGVSKTLAQGVMSYYTGTATTFADLPKPYYWWETGGMFGGMLDYSYLSNDTTYDDVIATALMAQAGPNHDFMLPKHYGDEGNDDQAFWGFAVLSAAERGFEQPARLTPAGMPGWQQLGENIWNSMVGRWNTSACGGGFAWQIFADNYNGLTYRNSVANGGFFQLSARLARLTGNQTYADWAVRVWDWSRAIGLVDDSYAVFDGVSTGDNCSTVNPLSFSYTTGIYLYGAAVMANLTAAEAAKAAKTGKTDRVKTAQTAQTAPSAAVWTKRATGLLRAAGAFFGGPESDFFRNATAATTGVPSPNNATNIMWEHACEGVGTCNTDMKSFKAFLSRFLYAAAAMLPTALAPQVHAFMTASATAAAAVCVGPSATAGGVPACGQKWYVGGFDASVGLGQQLSALEAVQGLILLRRTLDSPADGLTDGVAAAPTAAAAPSKSSAPAAVQTAGAAVGTVGLHWLVGLASAVFVWGCV